MDHIKYAYVALVGWGIWAIGSKWLSQHLNTTSVSFWISFWSLFFLSIFIIFKKNLAFNNYSLYAIPIGIVSLVAIIAFYRALRTGPASVVIPLTNLYLIFPVIFGFVFLKEAITVPRIAGIVCAIAASILLSL
jgi:transporter family protein